MSNFYREQASKCHLLITMYISDAITNPKCKGRYQAIQIMKNCVDDAYSQILGGDGFNLHLDLSDSEDD